MRTLYFEIPNIATILNMYDTIEVVRYEGLDSHPDTPVGEPSALTNWVEVIGTAPYTSPVVLLSNTMSYYVYDEEGEDEDWYASRYVDSLNPTTINSGWSAPILSSNQGYYYNPMYPDEIETAVADQAVISRIRTLIGDPVSIKRDSGEEAIVNLHPDGKVYALTEKGWPASVTMAGQQYNTIINPVVNGYKYLKFDNDVSEFTTISGVDYNIDIWYYTFRYSDREILETYDRTPPPFGLTSTNATSEAYVLATAIDMVRAELLLDAAEDGAKFGDDLTSYDPSPGLDIRRKLLEDLEKQLDRIVTSLKLKGISGVRID